MHLVRQSHSLLVQAPYVALYLQSMVVEFLTLLPGPQQVSSRASKSSVSCSSWNASASVSRIKSTPSSVATSSGSRPSQASQVGLVSLFITRPLQLGWSACEEKPQFHFLTRALELARLGASDSSGGSLLCLLGSDIRDSTSSAVSSSSSNATFIFSPTLRFSTNGRRTAKSVITAVSEAVNAALV